MDAAGERSSMDKDSAGGLRELTERLHRPDAWDEACSPPPDLVLPSGSAEGPCCMEHPPVAGEQGRSSSPGGSSSPVELPRRFRRLLRERRRRQSTVAGEEHQSDTDVNKETPKILVTDCEYASSDSAIDDDSDDGDDEEAARATDLEKAVRWIKQEIVKMRAQDQALARQFLDIEEGIARCRGRSGSFSAAGGSVSSSLGSFSDFSGSAVSLDERYHSATARSRRISALREEEHLTEFRPRTVSLLTPRSSSYASSSPSPSPLTPQRGRPLSRECDV